MNLTRRSFFKAGAAAGGGLLIGFYLPGLTQTAEAQSAVFAPNIWLRIARDDTVTIMLTQIEMGQGVMTSVPMLVAEDLDADWSKIGVEWVGADLAYANPGMDGVQMTAASQTTRGYWRMLREAMYAVPFSSAEMPPRWHRRWRMSRPFASQPALRPLSGRPGRPRRKEIRCCCRPPAQAWICFAISRSAVIGSPWKCVHWLMEIPGDRPAQRNGRADFAEAGVNSAL